MDYSEQKPDRIIGIIPARYGSTRFPGKPLVDINGRAMILRVYDQAIASGVLEDIVVATDDERIMEHVLAAGFKAVMTSADHPSGTDRCLEALDIFSRDNGKIYDFVINVQGDEPYLPPEQIRQVADILLAGEVPIASLVKKITRREDIFNPNTVKAVFKDDWSALYFSRSPIPFLRGVNETQWSVNRAHYKHVGIYGFRSEVLRQVCQLPPGRLEMAEALEQLRWLEAGYVIKLGLTELDNLSVDTPQDLLKITNTP